MVDSLLNCAGFMYEDRGALSAIIFGFGLWTGGLKSFWTAAIAWHGIQMESGDLKFGQSLDCDPCAPERAAVCSTFSGDTTKNLAFS